MTVDDLVSEMLNQCALEGQSARRVDDPSTVDELRAALRSAARERGVKIRTALIDDVIAVVRVDADLWNESTSVMREKLTPPADSDQNVGGQG